MRLSRSERSESLGATQEQILALLASKCTNAEIAERLGLSPDTVKWHVSQILLKLEVQTREEAADVWRSDRGLRRVLWRAPVGLVLGIGRQVGRGGPVLAGAGAVTAVGLLALSAFAVTRTGDEGGTPALGIEAVTATPTPEATAPEPQEAATPEAWGAAAPEPKVFVIRALWNTAWEIASDSQRPALADGELTFAEYEAAAMKTVACINAGGSQGEAILYTRTGTNTKTYQLAARYQSNGNEKPGDDNRRAEATHACYTAHWSGIGQAWGAQDQPSEQYLAEARSALAQCLRDAGLDVPDPLSEYDLSPFHRTAAFAPCAMAVATEYGLPNFAG